MAHRPAGAYQAAPGSPRAAAAALTLACMAWGLSFVFLDDADRSLERALGAGAWAAGCWTVAVRFLLAAALLLVWPAVRRGLGAVVWRDAFYLALPSAAGYVLQAAGMRGLEAGTNAFLTSLYTPLTPLLAWICCGRRPGAALVLAVGLALGGVAVLTGPGGIGFGVYEGLVVAGAFCWAVQILLIDLLARRHPTGAFAGALFAWTGLLGLTGLLAAPGATTPAAWLGALLRPDLQLPIWGLVLLATLFTLLVLVHFQPRLDPSRAALLYVLEPAFAAVFSAALRGESFGGWKLFGCLLLLAANLLPRPGRQEIRQQPELP